MGVIIYVLSVGSHRLGFHLYHAILHGMADNTSNYIFNGSIRWNTNILGIFRYAKTDQTGKEFLKRPYYNYPWDCVLRYGGNSNSSGTGNDNIKMLSRLGTYLDNTSGMGNIAAMKINKPMSGLGTYNKGVKPGSALDGYKRYRNKINRSFGMGTISEAMPISDTFSAGDAIHRNFRADESARLARVNKANASYGKGSLTSVSNKGTGNILGITKDSNINDIMSELTDYANKSKGKVDFNKLLNTIISALNTIAENTDNLNTIVKLLNERLGTNITAKDVSTNNKNKIKDKLRYAINRTSNEQLNDDSMNGIMNMMNAIASE